MLRHTLCRYVLLPSYAQILDLHRFATNVNVAFAKTPGGGENYSVEHSGNIVLVNPMGDYHGFFKPPFDADTIFF